MYILLGQTVLIINTQIFMGLTVPVHRRSRHRHRLRRSRKPRECWTISVGGPDNGFSTELIFVHIYGASNYVLGKDIK